MNSNYTPANSGNFNDDSDRDSTNSCSGYTDEEGTIYAYEREERDIDEEGDSDN